MSSVIPYVWFVGVVVFGAGLIGTTTDNSLDRALVSFAIVSVAWCCGHYFTRRRG